MNRQHFLRTLAFGAFGMSTFSAFRNFAAVLGEEERPMPVLFIGHGSPMNGIEDNYFSQHWAKLGKEIPKPKAVLVISAHWFTNGTRITAMPQPRTIHDFGGFPKELFEVQYPAPGSPELAKDAIATVKSVNVVADHDWGLDHGAWTVVRRMYPAANIPVLQLSMDYTQKPAAHFELAKELAALRKKGVLIIGSGNMVHNLGMLAWDKLEEPEYGYDWAIEQNTRFKKLITEGDNTALINFNKMGRSADLAIPTPEHYLPLLYILGLRGKMEEARFFNDRLQAGSLSMTSVRFG